MNDLKIMKADDVKGEGERIREANNHVSRPTDEVAKSSPSPAGVHAVIITGKRKEKCCKGKETIVGVPDRSITGNYFRSYPFYSRKRWTHPNVPFLFFGSERLPSEISEGCRGYPEYKLPDEFETPISVDDSLLNAALRNARGTDTDGEDLKCEASTEYISMLTASLLLYCFDVFTDALQAIVHLYHGRIAFGMITVFFMTSPAIVSILQNIYWRYYFGEKSGWRASFREEELNFFKSMLQSIEYAIKSRKSYSSVSAAYAKVDEERRIVIGEGCILKDWSVGMKLICKEMSARKEIQSIRPRCNASLMQSAPQALLQLMYYYLHRPSNVYDKVITSLGISTSLVNLAWGVHKTHYEMHFRKDWRNDLESNGCVEFYGILLVHCVRIMSLSKAIILMHNVFSAVWLGYLVLLIAILCYFTKRGRKYQNIFNSLSFIPWPLYRIFTVNVEVGLWRLDSLDHFLYFAEIFVLSLANNVIFFLDEIFLVYDIAGFFGGLFFLLIFKYYFHEKTKCGYE